MSVSHAIGGNHALTGGRRRYRSTGPGLGAYPTRPGSFWTAPHGFGAISGSLPTVGRNRCSGSCLEWTIATVQIESLQPFGLQMIDMPSKRFAGAL